MTAPLPDMVVKFKGDLAELKKDILEIEALLTGMGRSGKGAGDDIDAGVKKASQSVQDFDRLVTKNVQDGQTVWKSMQKTIADTRNEIERLTKEAGKTGSSSIFGDLKKAQSDLKTLEGFAKDLAPAFADSGEKAGQGFISSLLDTVSGGDGPIGISVRGALIGGIILASPLIVAMLNAAIVAAFGLGGVAVGIVGAISDPRVQTALSGLKDEMVDVFHQATAMFVGPFGAALINARAQLASLGPAFQGALQPLLKAVQPLIAGLVGFIQDMLPGLREGFANAEPIVEKLASLLPGLGSSIGGFFAEITRNGPAVSVALLALVNVIRGLLYIIGNVISNLSGVFQWLVHAVSDVTGFTIGFINVLHKLTGINLNWASGPLSDLKKNFDSNVASAENLGGSMFNLDGSFAQLNTDVANTAESMAQLTQEYEAWYDQTNKARDANLKAHETLTQLQDAIKKGKVSWDINTQAGQQMIEKLYAVDAANKNYFDSLHSITPKTVGDYLAQEQSLYKMAKAAGAPKDVLAQMRQEIQKLRAQLDTLNGKKINFYVNEHDHVTFTVTAPSQFFHGLSQGGIAARAQGGVDYAGIAAFAQSGVQNGMKAFAGGGMNSGVYSGGPRQSLIKFAEPSTRGEAYIARNGNIGGQISALQSAVSWLTERSPFSGSSSQAVGVNMRGSIQPIVIHSPIYIDGKQVSRNQIVHNQRTIFRNGFSGQG